MTATFQPTIDPTQLFHQGSTQYGMNMLGYTPGFGWNNLDIDYVCSTVEPEFQTPFIYEHRPAIHATFKNVYGHTIYASVFQNVQDGLILKKKQYYVILNSKDDDGNTLKWTHEHLDSFEDTISYLSSFIDKKYY